MSTKDSPTIPPPAEVLRGRVARARAAVRRKHVGRLRDLLAWVDVDAWCARFHLADAVVDGAPASSIDRLDGQIEAFSKARRRIARLLGMSEAEIDARERRQIRQWAQHRQQRAKKESGT